MKITRENYEVFFLDYLDGNLEEKDMDQFLDFLKQNSDLKDELRALEQIRLPGEQVIMQDKESLYKNQTNETEIRENILVAYLEGDLDEDERKATETNLVTDTELQNEYLQLIKTRLMPDKKIHYPDKRRLYRKSASVIVINWIARAAAVALLIWGISSVIPNAKSPGTPNEPSEIARLGPTSEIKTNPAESVKKVQQPNPEEKIMPVKNTPPVKSPAFRKKLIPEAQVGKSSEPVVEERENTVLAEIQPIRAQLGQEIIEAPLALNRTRNNIKPNKSQKEIGLEDFLAERAKRVGNEGLNSFQRLAKFGLGLASEISGDRISYNEKNGKISSVEFESKLLAFTIPLEKK